MSLSVGTICGTSAPTAGVWTPAPTDRITSTASMTHGSCAPASMASARAAVAIMASAPMMSIAGEPIGPDPADDRHDGLREEPDHHRQGRHRPRLRREGQVPP